MGRVLGDALGDPAGSAESVMGGLGASASAWDPGEDARCDGIGQMPSGTARSAQSRPPAPSSLACHNDRDPPADKPRVRQSFPAGQGGPAETPQPYPHRLSSFPAPSSLGPVTHNSA